MHVPNTPETENMITAELVAMIPDGAVVINSARAASVDSAALVAAAATGRLSAALDVYDVEPVTPPHRVGRLSQPAAHPARGR